MSVFLWCLQGILAALFALSGLGKAFQPRAKIVAKYPVFEDYSAETTRFIGAMELLGAVGLIVPGALGLVPVLTPTAAAGLALLTLLAARVHLRRGETQGVAMTGVLFLLTTLIAVLRFGPYSW